MDLDLPYFGGALQTTLLCPACGYRHGDLLLTRRGEPVRFTLRAVRPEHRSARVARSSSGTVRIPELGASLEPGPRADAFVSNVEGVLRKFLDVVQGQEAVADTARDRKRLRGVHARIQRLIDGVEPFTFILEDPTGNSLLVHEDAVRETLSREEAARLKTSEAVLDLADLLPADEEE
jgi:zinc finger protein